MVMSRKTKGMTMDHQGGSTSDVRHGVNVYFGIRSDTSQISDMLLQSVGGIWKITANYPGLIDLTVRRDEGPLAAGVGWRRKRFQTAVTLWRRPQSLENTSFRVNRVYTAGTRRGVMY
ncbi:hypothetical protein J6590_074521 [Homalodisca vitripennis]|nr:hypothetical protein J6590_074521 [Homalodisca vitripennis]